MRQKLKAWWFIQTNKNSLFFGTLFDFFMLKGIWSNLNKRKKKVKMGILVMFNYLSNSERNVR